MNRYIYLAWQEPNSRKWHVIGKLSRSNTGYEFRYTQGVRNINALSILPNMTNIEEVYHSNELFSLFKNRLMPTSRPDYFTYINWMGIKDVHKVDELDALGISGGERETDSFRIIPVPQKNDRNEYSFKFFVNGISHINEANKEKVDNLNEDQRLYLSHEFQNKVDMWALSLLTDDPIYMVGYIPAYFTKIIHAIKDEKGFDSIIVKVLQVNKDAPFQKKLLCELSSPFLDQPWEKYEDEFKLISID